MQPADTLHSFHSATDWKFAGNGRFLGVLTEDWTQGRTAFGGFIVAGAIRALDTMTGAHFRPRTLSATLMDRIDQGEFEAQGAILRTGRSVTVAEMQIRQGATHAATVLASFGVERPSRLRIEADFRPERPAPDQLPVIPYLPGIMPPCQQHIESRYTDGNVPFTNSGMTVSAGWIRLKNAGSHAASRVAAMLDAFPFPFMQTMGSPAPSTTIMFTAHLLDIEGTEPDGWWWLRNETVHAADGYATFTTRLYRPDGRLGACAEQLVGVYDKS